MTSFNSNSIRRHLTRFRDTMLLLVGKEMTAAQVAEAAHLTMATAQSYLLEGKTHGAIIVVRKAATGHRQMHIMTAPSVEAIDAAVTKLEAEIEHRDSDTGKRDRRTLRDKQIAAGRRLVNNSGDAEWLMKRLRATPPVQPDPNPLISGAWLARAAA